MPEVAPAPAARAIMVAAACSAGLSVAWAPSVAAQVTAVRLLSEGDSYDPFGTGDPSDFESVEAISRPYLNATGGYAVRARTIVPFNNTGIAFLFGDDTGTDGFTGAILHEEISDTVNDNGTPRMVAGYGARIAISDAGVLSHSANIIDGGGSQFGGIVVGNDVVISGTTAITDQPGSSFSEQNFVGAAADGATQYLSSGFGGDNIGLFRHDLATGNITTVLDTGDAIGGGNVVLPESQGNFFGNTDFSRANHHYLTSVDINPAVFSQSNPFPITDALIVDGSIPTALGSSSLLIEDVLIPSSAGGIAGEVWEGFNEKAINSSGNWITGATTNADDLTGGGEWIIVKDAEIVFRGDGTILGVDINDAGDFVFAYNEAIYLNGEIVIDNTTPVDTGETIAKLQFGVSLSERNANNEVTIGFKARDNTDPDTGAFGPDLYAAVIPVAAMIMGDFNDSGQVEQGDLDLVLQNWGVDTDVSGVPAGWTNNLPEGQIEQTELDKVLQNWGNTSAPDFSGSSVPEPAAALLLPLLSVVSRRRRRGTS